MPIQATNTKVVNWRDGLAIPLSWKLAQAAGMSSGLQVRLCLEPGRIVVESLVPSAWLATMLAAFDPIRHGGEVLF